MKEIRYAEPGNTEATEARNFAGGYNSLPPGWRELTEAEFAKAHFDFEGAKFIEYRQMHPEEKGQPVISATLFYTAVDEGFAIKPEYWKGKMRYFAFGCKHEWEELSYQQCIEEGIQHFGMCWHVYRCPNCGKIMSCDSSD